MVKRFTLLFVVVLLSACQERPIKPSGPEILKESIRAAGGPSFFNSSIQFNVGDLFYDLYRKEHISKFTVDRETANFKTRATYDNGYVEYFVDGVKQESGTYSQRILDAKFDGFIYTFSLPHVLDQNAVIVERLEDVTIRKKNYYVLHISYTQVEGGHDDQFYLYIDPDTFFIEFYALRYYLSGGENLFRRNINGRMINGLRFNDYYSFAPKNDSIPLEALHKYYEAADLREVEKIELTNVTVEFHNDSGQ